MAEEEDERRAALDKLLPLQQQRLRGALRGDGAGCRSRSACSTRRCTSSCPTPRTWRARSSALASSRRTTWRSSSATLDRVHELAETNPMLGTRGVRLGVLHPEIYEMQARAIVRAARAVAERTGEAPRLEIMIPLVAYEKELELMRDLVQRVVERGGRGGLDLIIGTMIELPRACFVADRIAEQADFFSFGTNDLTQTALGFSRDDVEGQLPPAVHREEDPGSQPVRDDRQAWRRLAGAAGRLGRAAGQAGPEARRLRRAWRRPRLDPLLPARRARLRELLSVPRADRPRGCRAGGHRCRPVTRDRRWARLHSRVRGTLARLKNWRGRMAAVAVVAVAVAVTVSTALAHVERASYWPDPKPDKSVRPAAGGKVPKARSLYTALRRKAVGDTRVVCQNSSISRLRNAIYNARTKGYKLRPVGAQALHQPKAGQEAARVQPGAVVAVQVPARSRTPSPRRATTTAS